MAGNLSARPNQRKLHKGSRRDPAFKPTTGGFHEMRLNRKNPNKHYVLVDTSIKEMRDHYYAMGYRPEEAGPDSPFFVAGLTTEPGNVIEARGCVLMSIDKSIRDEIDEDGKEYARGRMEAVRKARDIRNMDKEYRGDIGAGAGIEPLDGETTYIDIPSRGRE